MVTPIAIAYDAAESLLVRAIHVLETGNEPLSAALAELPAPIYVTDAEGLITYYNPACVTLAGRSPTLGRTDGASHGDYILTKERFSRTINAPWRKLF